MTTTLKLILAAASITAALASPAAASNHRFAPSAANSLSGSGFPTNAVPVIQDCVHVTFPQCGGTGL